MDLEILIGTDTGLSIFDDKTSGAIASDWSMYRGNAYRNGVFESSFELGCDAGDINGDMINDILDIVLLVNIITGSIDPTGDQGCAADINSDGITDILDIVLLVNLITG